MRCSDTQTVDRRCHLGAMPVGTFMAIVCAAAVLSAATHDVVISLATNDDGQRVFELRGDEKALAAVGDQSEQHFAVYVIFDINSPDPPPVAGEYSVVDGAVRFTPRFPLQPGMRYRAVYRPASGEGDDQRAIIEEFAIPARNTAAAARVVAIFPSAATLPENQLKFYIHFTVAMSRGGAYEHLQLLDGEGKPVDLPFLELAEELWNPTGDRLTLLLDPGRVKQELLPREEVGPVLVAGRHYTLVVDRNWRDAAGQPLAAESRKSFAVTVADEICPNPKKWRLTVPQAGSRSPLVVRFGESLDHALLERMLWVADEEVERVRGDIKIGESESSWQFQPQQPWQAGRYRLMADTLLEDLAGNSVARKFELDARRAATATSKDDVVSVEFQIKE
jgi:hypothetical protein